METLVVGAGAMGCWTARLAREALDADLAFLDRDPETAQAAAADVGGRAVDAAALSADPDGEDAFGVVCVAVPIPAAAAAIGRHGPRAGEAVVDVTGTMAEPVAAMAGLAGRERASLHPLFAPDSEPGNVPVVIEESGPVVERLLGTLTERGNSVVETTPAEHDRAMETVQARTHAAVLTFALAAEPVPEGFHTPVSAELDALAGRITGGDPRVYGDIQQAFDGAGDIAAAARRVADAETGSFAGLYREAAGRVGATRGDTSGGEDG